MHLTMLGHSCMRLEAGGRTLVIDPGIFSDRSALDGADAVLVTHEHADHFDADFIRGAMAANPALELWSNASVAGGLADLGDRVHVAAAGDVVDPAGFSVAVQGELHAEIHPEIPRVRNICFLVNGDIFHPGDSLTRSGTPVRTLLLPVNAPWLKFADGVEWARSIRPELVVAIHDGFLNDRGLALVDPLLGSPLLAGDGPAVEYRRLVSGETIDR